LTVAYSFGFVGFGPDDFLRGAIKRSFDACDGVVPSSSLQPPLSVYALASSLAFSLHDVA
jgi:hypothetical protein